MMFNMKNNGITMGQEWNNHGKTDDLPSGIRLHSELENHHFL